MKVSIAAFRGMVERYAPRLLEPGTAQYARNCDVRDGDLLPFRGVRSEATLPSPATVKTVYRWEGQSWLRFTQDVDVVGGPVPDNTEGRVYWTGDGVPQMSYAGIITSSGDGNYPSNSYDLGVPAPTQEPSVAVTGSPDDSSDPVEERAYVYTYVSAKGEEGAPSDSSSIVKLRPGQSVDVTGLLTGPGGNLNLSAKRVYRTVTAADGSVSWRLVAEIALATTSYTDSKSVAQVASNAVLPSEQWDTPPSDLKGLVAHPGGFLVGFRSNELCPSVAFTPHAWPVDFRLQTEPDIVAIGVVGASIVVGTTDYPYIAQGSDPSALALVRGESPAPCLSKRGMVDMGDAVAYPSHEGLIAFAGYTPRNITEEVFTPEQWQNFNPSSFEAWRHGDQYVAFYKHGAPGALVIPMHGRWAVHLDLEASAGWTDPESGHLYVVQNGNELGEFDAAAIARMTASWRSGEQVLPTPINYALARVIADSYPLTLRTYTDGTLRQTVQITDGTPHWLVGGFRSRRWSFEVEHDDRVRVAEIADAVEEFQ